MLMLVNEVPLLFFWNQEKCHLCCHIILTITTTTTTNEKNEEFFSKEKLSLSLLR